jgi:copper homeostasis protein
MARLEIASFSVASAVIAQQSGAHRIELCADRSAGGITPDISVFTQVKALVEIPIYVMIRPRGGDFVFTTSEFESMKQQLLQFKQAGVSGFVFGCLQENGSIHEAQNKELVQLAHPLPCTFHRAFDGLQYKQQALQTVIDCGFQNILTAGHAGNATEGLASLQQLHHWANGKITIIAGGGIRSTVLPEISTQTKVSWVHSAAITCGEEADPLEIKALLDSIKS